MRLVFDAVAPDWSKIRADPSYSDGFMEALTYLPREFRPPQILDASCGHGLASSLLVERWPDRSVTGVDISPRMVDIARKHVPDATFLVGSVHHLPFEDGAFDLITSLDGLVDPAEFMRVLHRKGRILIVYSMRATTPISRNLDDLAAAFATHGGNATAHLDGMAHALVVRHRR
jgi:ubiquinone/menaquinone biosynthesis C-methylase UbiE